MPFYLGLKLPIFLCQDIQKQLQNTMIKITMIRRKSNMIIAQKDKIQTWWLLRSFVNENNIGIQCSNSLIGTHGKRRRKNAIDEM